MTATTVKKPVPGLLHEPTYRPHGRLSDPALADKLADIQARALADPKFRMSLLESSGFFTKKGKLKKSISGG